MLYGFPKELLIEYEDDNLLVAYKPQGILSNNEESFQTEPTFEDFVKSKKGENIKICHRLDRNTSGLVVFSKNDLAYSELLEAFKSGYITKEYIAYSYSTNFQNKSYHYENYLLKDKKTGYSKIYSSNVVGSQKIITDIIPENINKKLLATNPIIAKSINAVLKISCASRFLPQCYSFRYKLRNRIRYTN